MKTKDIPISAAKGVAEKYGYDQIIIIGRKVGDDGREHCTTYGVDKANCDVAARIGDFLKHKVMGWSKYGDCTKCNVPLILGKKQKGSGGCRYPTCPKCGQWYGILATV